MARVLVVEDEDVTRLLLEKRLSGAGHWLRTAGSADEARSALRRGRPEVLSKPASLEALERAIDAAIEASPPALMTAVRARLARLGVEDGEEECVIVARLLDLFVDTAPERLATVEAALDTGDDTALEDGVAQLGRAAAHLGAAPLARLCADLEDRARSGSVPPAAAVRAALRRELTVTCRVLSSLTAELARGGAGTRTWPPSADRHGW